MAYPNLPDTKLSRCGRFCNFGRLCLGLWSGQLSFAEGLRRVVWYPLAQRLCQKARAPCCIAGPLAAGRLQLRGRDTRACPSLHAPETRALLDLLLDYGVCEVRPGSACAGPFSG